MIWLKALRFLVVVTGFAGALLLSSCAQWARDRADDKLKKGQYEEAMSDLREGLKRYPDNNVLRTGLLTAQNEALAKLTQQINQQRGFGQYDEALKTVQRAAAIEPNNPRLATLSAEIAQDYLGQAPASAACD
jgi:general secretion pathway protein D